jgi:O-antigen/teichoic acid export membrane protein
MGLFDKILNTQTKKRFFNAILFGIGGTIISKAFLMLFNVIAARILGETKYGIYSLINNTVQTFIVFAGAGIGVTLTRYVALYRDKDKDMTGIVIKTLLIFNTILSAIISVIVFAPFVLL